MCDPFSIIAGGAILGAGSAIAGGIQAGKQADKVDAYNAQVTEQNKAYRLEVMQYQNENYAADIVQYHNEIDYEKGEFDRASALVTNAKTNIEKDYTQKVGTQILKAVQEDVFKTLQLKDIMDQGFAASGKVDVSNGERGVAGNSADLLSGEVGRQVGVARTAVNRNFDAAQTQNKLELLGLKGQRDTALASQTMLTFSPIQPPAPPAPVSPVNPAPPTQHVSTGTIVLGGLAGGFSGASTGLSLYNALRLPVSGGG